MARLARVVAPGSISRAVQKPFRELRGLLAPASARWLARCARNRGAARCRSPRLSAWNLRIPGLHLVGQVAACLGEDFDSALHQPSLLPIGLKASSVTP